MSYWHNFRRGKTRETVSKKDTVYAGVERRGVGVTGAPGSNDVGDGQTHPQAPSIGVVAAGGGSEARPTTTQAAERLLGPRTYEEKAVALSVFDIDEEAAQMADFIGFSMAHLVNINGAQRHNIYIHCREVLRRCAIVHMNLPEE